MIILFLLVLTSPYALQTPLRVTLELIAMINCCDGEKKNECFAFPFLLFALGVCFSTFSCAYVIICNMASYLHMQSSYHHMLMSSYVSQGRHGGGMILEMVENEVSNGDINAIIHVGELQSQSLEVPSFISRLCVGWGGSVCIYSWNVIQTTSYSLLSSPLLSSPLLLSHLLSSPLFR